MISNPKKYQKKTNSSFVGVSVGICIGLILGILAALVITLATGHLMHWVYVLPSIGLCLGVSVGIITSKSFWPELFNLLKRSSALNKRQ